MGRDDITYGGKPSDFEGGGEGGRFEFNEELLLDGRAGDVGGGAGLLVHPNDAGGVVLVEFGDSLRKTKLVDAILRCFSDSPRSPSWACLIYIEGAMRAVSCMNE